MTFCNDSPHRLALRASAWYIVGVNPNPATFSLPDVP